jgi:hypothetical protein
LQAVNTDLLPDTEAERKRIETAQADAERTLGDDFRWLMTSPRGRRLARWILETTGVHRSSFHNSGSVTAFNEGQRNVGLVVLSKLMEHAHPGYLQMLDEHQKANTK